MTEAPRNLAELAEQSCTRFAERPVFGTKDEGRWVWTTYGELGQMIDRCRAGLHALGVRRDSVVAVIANNSVEWAVTYFAVHGLEAIFVPLYESQLPRDWHFILNDCGACVVVARAGLAYTSVVDARADLPKVQHVVGIGLAPDDPSSFDALLAPGARPIPRRDPDPSQTAGLIYTSGTMGNPKGVVLSHGNVTSNAVMGREIFPLSPEDRTLSFLPWAHSYGQLELHWTLIQGVSLALNDDIKQLLPNLADVKPTILVAVPRIFNRVYEAVRSDIATRPQLVQKLFDAGIRAATRKARGEHLGVLPRIELEIDDKLMFKKIRDRFGGRLRYAMSASAALSVEVAQFVNALGIEVYEGYGLTETSPMVSANTPTARRMGSVGKVLPGVRVVIDTEAGAEAHAHGGQGEIVVYGPNVMQGYHNRPEENATVFTLDGGLRTGDLGYIDSDGFLYVTGRIKEQYKLLNGMYVMPAPLEEQLKLSPYIANVMLHGANRAYNVALVVLEEASIRAWAVAQGIELTDITRDARVEQLIGAELERLAEGFRPYEVPRRALLITEDFTTDNDLLTPTLKLKRRRVESRYGAALDALYEQPAPLSAATT